MLKEINKYTWNLKTCHGGKYVYAARSIDKMSLHRFITNAGKGTVVDHINGNTLDNRIKNLRVGTYSQNALNKKPDSHWRGKERKLKLKGIRLSKYNRYIVNAYDVENKKRVYLGSFKKLTEAKKTYRNYVISKNSKYIEFMKLGG